jgi:Mg2+-importing ATPase
VQSGSGTALVIATGTTTEFGQLSQRLKFKTPETEFERSVRRFGYLLMEVTLILVMLIFAVNVYLAKPIVDSFLFALALAVGLTPQLLPAVISVNLARGAKRMAAQKVIVKQLAAIENFGSMNVLCSDKTGTLTEGVVHLHGALDISGQPSDKVARYAYLNATFENGFNNPIDEAICLNQQFDSHNCQKLAEIPYDFYRKRLSVLMIEASGTIIVTICSDVELADGAVLDIKAARAQIDLDFQSFSRQGYRTLGLAYKVMGDAGKLDKTDEINMRLFGYLLFRDPPKAGCTETIQHLHELGVALKIITCDNHLVAATIGKELGLGNRQVVGDSNIQHRELAAHEMLTGPEIDNVGDLALINRVGTVHLFSEVEPNQKERIIIALKKAGNVVGYMGDGINDVSALHAADVGISVDSAADATKESAQIVLLEKDLGVLIQGIKEGRVTFANTLKYVFMATSSNFGNMFSMAGASLFLPFLPLLPKQILLTDLPEMTIATDTVDSDMVAQPRRWDIRFIRQFMMTFGLVSSLFDFMTFGLLLLIDVTPEQFRTGWFVESVISAALIVFVVRSSKPFFKTRPGRYLLQATLAIVVITVALPYSPIAPVIGFVPLPLPLMAMLGLIVTLYLASAELTKHFFYRMVKI